MSDHSKLGNSASSPSHRAHAGPDSGLRWFGDPVNCAGHSLNRALPSLRIVSPTASQDFRKGPVCLLRMLLDGRRRRRLRPTGRDRIRNPVSGERTSPDCGHRRERIRCGGWTCPTRRQSRQRSRRRALKSVSFPQVCDRHECPWPDCGFVSIPAEPGIAPRPSPVCRRDRHPWRRRPHTPRVRASPGEPIPDHASPQSHGSTGHCRRRIPPWEQRL